MIGNNKFGVRKYLTQYIKTRPLNIGELQHTVDKFMFHFDRIRTRKEEERRKDPRRNKKWINTIESDGFKKIHYQNKILRRKHRAIRLPAIPNNGDKAEGTTNNAGTHSVNPYDTFNAPPEKKLYSKERKREYNELNEIRDYHEQRRLQKLRKQERAKDQIKNEVQNAFVTQKMNRIGRVGFKLANKMAGNMRETTNLRKHRNFKPYM